MNKDEEVKSEIKVGYQCQHLTCRMECYTGELTLAKERFELLKQYAPEDHFKSPSGLCKISSAQDFKIISVEDVLQDPDVVRQRIKQLELKKKELTREYKSNNMKLIHQIKSLRQKLEADSNEVSTM